MEFIADNMLGRLAKWLRLLGYDTLYLPYADDPALARAARAEDRVLLTRDVELTRRRGIKHLLIESERKKSAHPLLPEAQTSDIIKPEM